MDGYTTATLHQRIDDLLKARFRKTWYVYSGKDAGKRTLKPPFPYNPKLRLWTGKLPATEIEDLILATGMILDSLDAKGYLSRESASIAVVYTISNTCLYHVISYTVYIPYTLQYVLYTC
jgi:hypothetical protein